MGQHKPVSVDGKTFPSDTHHRVTAARCQKDRLRSAFLRGERLTPQSALLKYGCMRLAARVCDFRREGIDIEARMVERDGIRFAEYRRGSAR